MKTHEIFIPLDVPFHAHKEYINNYSAITHNTGKLFLFACDQKLEHLNSDFYGSGIHPNAMHPEHLFRIAQNGSIGAMATPLGLISRYAKQYNDVTYIAKLNGKTNLGLTDDPYSKQLWNIQDVLQLKEQNIAIAGIGITIYLGSRYEPDMLAAAAQTVFQAHQHGLIAIIWAYPRGASIENETHSDLVAGAAGIATTLGADFVKVHPPQKNATQSSAQLLQVATAAAGNTKLICSGGKLDNPEHFLQELFDQLHTGHAHGCAVGRNIFQRSLSQAIALTNAIAHIVYKNGTIAEACTLFNEQKE